MISTSDVIPAAESTGTPRGRQECYRKSRIGVRFGTFWLLSGHLVRLALAHSNRFKTLMTTNPSRVDRRRIRRVFSRPLEKSAIVREYDMPDQPRNESVLGPTRPSRRDPPGGVRNRHRVPGPRLSLASSVASGASSSSASLQRTASSRRSPSWLAIALTGAPVR